jgi:hypothetical protein
MLEFHRKEQMEIMQGDDKAFYITITRLDEKIVGSADFSLSMALENVLEQLRDDAEFWS